MTSNATIKSEAYANMENQVGTKNGHSSNTHPWPFQFEAQTLPIPNHVSLRQKKNAHRKHNTHSQQTCFVQVQQHKTRTKSNGEMLQSRYGEEPKRKLDTSWKMPLVVGKVRCARSVLIVVGVRFVRFVLCVQFFVFLSFEMCVHSWLPGWAV